MLEEISYYMILGIPLIVYLGVLTLISFIATAAIAIMNQKGNTKIPLKWHFHMAKISILLALIHGSLGIMAYL